MKGLPLTNLAKGIYIEGFILWEDFVVILKAEKDLPQASFSSPTKAKIFEVFKSQSCQSKLCNKTIRDWSQLPDPSLMPFLNLDRTSNLGLKGTSLAIKSVSCLQVKPFIQRFLKASHSYSSQPLITLGKWSQKPYATGKKRTNKGTTYSPACNGRGVIWLMCSKDPGRRTVSCYTGRQNHPTILANLSRGEKIPSWPQIWNQFDPEQKCKTI